MTNNDTNDFDEDKARRVEELQQHENRERYLDIVNVHAAATAQQELLMLNESYRSHEDTLEKSNTRLTPNKGARSNLMDAYGLGDRWGLQEDDKDDHYGSA